MEELFEDTKKKMSGALNVLQKDFNRVRTGRANTSMLEGISVDYYGNKTPLNQVGNITVPDPQLIIITPWEKNMLSEIGKAISRADLGMSPQNDGNVIRLPIPPLTEERRIDLVKQIKKLGEKAKLSIRNVRRDANEKLKKMEKSKEISQDQEKTDLVKIQDITDDFIRDIDQAISNKEKDLMEV